MKPSQDWKKTFMKLETISGIACLCINWKSIRIVLISIKAFLILNIFTDPMKFARYLPSSPRLLKFGNCHLNSQYVFVHYRALYISSMSFGNGLMHFRFVYYQWCTRILNGNSRSQRALFKTVPWWTSGR